MGLPQLTFELKKAADTVVARTTQGIIGMILKDTKALGVHVIYQESDIPTDLGADNIAYIKRALTGYINRPSCIFLAVVDSTSGTVSGGFADLGQYSYDYLVGPPNIASPDTTSLATLVTNQRTNRYIGKLVLPSTASDNEGIINFTATNIKVGSTTYDAGDYASRIAGVLAGAPFLVAETASGRLAGYACAHPYHAREAYAWSVETTIYCSPDFVGQGVGRRLYAPLLALLREQGYCRAAALLARPNPESEAFHRAMGFRKVGCEPQAGFKFGRWLGVTTWWYDLNTPATPAPVRRQLPAALVEALLAKA